MSFLHNQEYLLFLCSRQESEYDYWDLLMKKVGHNAMCLWNSEMPHVHPYYGKGIKVTDTFRIRIYNGISNVVMQLEYYCFHVKFTLLSKRTRKDPSKIS
jgi:hypothetical protein